MATAQIDKKKKLPPEDAAGGATAASAMPAATTPKPAPLPTVGSLPTPVVRRTLMQKVGAGPSAFGGLPNAPAPGSAMARSDQHALNHPGNVFGIPTGNDTRNPYAAQVAAAASPAAAGQTQVPVAAPMAPAPVDNRPSAEKVGTAMRGAGHSIANAATWLGNDANVGFDKAQNAITQPFRAADAWMNNVASAATGQPGNSVPAQDVKTPLTPLPYPEQPAAAVGSVGAGAGAAPAAPAGDPTVDISKVGLPDWDKVRADNAASANAAPNAALADPRANSGTVVQPGANGQQRTLPVGAMVNGVPTYSDGSGPGGIPRTMTDDQIQHYGDNLGRADAGALGHALASDSRGGQTQTQEQMVDGLVRGAPARPITGYRPSAEQFAAADRLSIATQDPRSAAGIAARKLSMEAQYGGTKRLRRMAEASLLALQKGSQESGVIAQQGEAAQAAGAQRDNASMALERLRGGNDLANTKLSVDGQAQNRAKQQIVKEDGSISLIDSVTGAETPVRGPDGKPVKARATKEDAQTTRTNQILDDISKGAQEQKKNFLPSKDKPELTPDEARELSARLQGLPVVRNDKTGESQVYINNQWVPL